MSQSNSLWEVQSEFSAQSMNQNVLRQLLETLYRRVIVRPVYHLGMFFEHPAGRTLTSDWLKNTFTLVVYEKIF